MQSRIPNVGVKRPKNNKTMLKDVTNRYSYTSSLSRPNTKLTFGDETSIELVKNRQRRVLTEINSLNQTIKEINKAIANLQDHELVKLQDDHASMIQDMGILQKDIEQRDEDISKLEDDLQTMVQSEKMHVSNEMLRYKIECQDKFNQLDLQFIDKRSKLEDEWNEFQASFQPPSALTEDIKSHETTLTSLKGRWTTLQHENELKIKTIEQNELIPPWSSFKQEKQDKLTHLQNQNDILIRDHKDKLQHRDQLQIDINTLDNKIVGNQKCIDETEQNISSLTQQTLPPLTNHLTSLDDDLKQSQCQLDLINSQYHQCHWEHEQQHKKLDIERKRNKALTAAISKP